MQTPTAETSSSERLFGSRAGRVLFVIGFGSTAGMTARLLIPPLLPSISIDLAISPAQAGLILTTMWGLAAAAQYPAGRLADAVSYKSVLATSLGVLAIGTTFLAASSTYLTFVLGAVVIGLGAGLYPPAAMMKINELFVQRRAQALGVNTALINLGGVLASGIAVVVLLLWSWRVGFVIAIALLLTVLALLHRSVDEPYSMARTGLDLRRTGRRVFGSPDIRWALISYSLFEITWLGGSSFLPTFLQVEKGFSPVFASTAFASVFGIGMLVTPFVGRLGDWVSYPKIAALAALSATTGWLVLTFSTTPAVIVAGILLAATGLAGFWPVMHAHTMAFLDESNKAGDFGAIRTIFLGIGGIGPAYVGFVAERASFTLAFAGLAPCLLLPMLVMIWRGQKE